MRLVRGDCCCAVLLCGRVQAPCGSSFVLRPLGRFLQSICCRRILRLLLHSRQLRTILSLGEPTRPFEDVEVSIALRESLGAIDMPQGALQIPAMP